MAQAAPKSDIHKYFGAGAGDGLYKLRTLFIVK
jgi:hypothetical protein